MGKSQVHPLEASGISTMPSAGRMLMKHPGRLTAVIADGPPPGRRSCFQGFPPRQKRQSVLAETLPQPWP